MNQAEIRRFVEIIDELKYFAATGDGCPPDEIRQILGKEAFQALSTTRGRLQAYKYITCREMTLEHLRDFSADDHTLNGFEAAFCGEEIPRMYKDLRTWLLNKPVL